MTPALQRILRDLGIPNLADALSDRIAATDLQTLLLDVYRRRSLTQPPSAVLDRFAKDRFSQPSPVDPRLQVEFDALAFALAAPEFEPIELSPVCPLGTVSTVTNVSQNNAVATSRNSEVVSDCTNVMALESARRRRSDPKKEVRLCASHRLLRPQQFPDLPGYFAHFRVFALTTAGRDRGASSFEIQALSQQVDFYLRLLSAASEAGCEIERVHVRIVPFEPRLADLVQHQVFPTLSGSHPDTVFELDLGRTAGRSYYRDIAFQIHVTGPDEKEWFLVDGGFTDWTQKLLSNGKERLLISGIGTERLLASFRSGPSSNS